MAHKGPFKFPHIMYPHTFSGEGSVQIKTEFLSFIDLLKREQIKSYLEIGAGRGDTFHEIATQMPVGSKVVAVDFPEQHWGLHKSQKQLIKVVFDLQQKGYKPTVEFGNSKDPDVIKVAKQHGPYDCVFIDGDHSLEGVTADWENYGELGKMVAFHDIAHKQIPNKYDELIEVHVLWDKLKTLYRHVEFIEKDSTMGIGVIFRD